MDTWLGTGKGTRKGKGERNRTRKGKRGREGKMKGERKRRPEGCEWDIDGHELGKRMSGKGREMGDERWEQADGGR